jgi:hypothetical protein
LRRVLAALTIDEFCRRRPHTGQPRQSAWLDYASLRLHQVVAAKLSSTTLRSVRLRFALRRACGQSSISWPRGLRAPCPRFAQPSAARPRPISRKMRMSFTAPPCPFACGKLLAMRRGHSAQSTRIRIVREATRQDREISCQAWLSPILKLHG